MQFDLGGNAVAVEQDVQGLHAFFPKAVKSQIPRDGAACRGVEGDVQWQGAQAIGRQQEFVLGVDLGVEGEIVAGRADLVNAQIGIADIGDLDDLAAVFANGDLTEVDGGGADLKKLPDSRQVQGLEAGLRLDL